MEIFILRNMLVVLVILIALSSYAAESVLVMSTNKTSVQPINIQNITKLNHTRAKLFLAEELSSESLAYKLQKSALGQVVANKKAVIGYKAGVMNEAAYKSFQLSSPVTGVFLDNALLKPNLNQPVTVSRSSAYHLMIEQEFAFKLSQDIHQAITPESVYKFVGSVSAAIELPDISFPSNAFTGLDIIANNVLAYKFITSEWKPLTPNLLSQLDTATLKLFCGDKLVTQGLGNKALGSQRKALVWMINHLLEQGFELRQGHILLTGNLIGMTVAKPCKYRAEFSPLFDETVLIITP